MSIYLLGQPRNLERKKGRVFLPSTIFSVTDSYSINYPLSLMDSFLIFNYLLFIYLFWLCQVLVATCGLLLAACELSVAACMRDLVPQPGIKPQPPALGVWRLIHWTTREVPSHGFLNLFICFPVSFPNAYG